MIKMAELHGLPDDAVVLDPAAGVGGFILEPLHHRREKGTSVASQVPFGPVGVRYSDSNHAARPWYSWMSPPSRSRRRTSRGLTGTGTLAPPSGVARRMAR